MGMMLCYVILGLTATLISEYTHDHSRKARCEYNAIQLFHKYPSEVCYNQQYQKKRYLERCM